MKSVLFLANKVPYSIDSGWAINAILANLYALSKIGKIIFIGIRQWDISKNGKEKNELAYNLLSSYCDSIHFVDPLNVETGSIIQRVNHLGRNGLKMSAFWPNKEIINLIEKYKKEFQIAWFQSTFTAHYISEVKNENIKAIIHTDNVESDLERQFFNKQPIGVSKIRSLIRLFNIVYAEKKYLQKFDRVLAISEEDAQVYRKFLPLEKINILPIAIDIRPYEKTGFNHHEKALIFVGGMSYFPNQYGIKWFVNEVLPLIKQSVPEIKFYIVGKNPPADIQKMVSETIIITGRVDSPQQYLEKASISVCPLLDGSGSRLKIIEAMSAGLPVVCTSKGAEGIKVTHGENILIADNPQEFANCVIELLNQPEKREELGKKAREFVTEHYSWNAKAKFVENIINSL